MAKKVKHNAVFNTISHQSPDNSLVDGIDKAKIENYDRLAFENTKLQAQIEQYMRENSELMVITKSKDLIAYLLEVTENAPKKYRFSLTGKCTAFRWTCWKNLYLPMKCGWAIRNDTPFKKMPLQN